MMPGVATVRDWPEGNDNACIMGRPRGLVIGCVFSFEFGADRILHLLDIAPAAG